MSLTVPGFATAGALPRRPAGPLRAPAGLVAQAADALEASEIRYCQWKGQGRQDRWLAAEGDIDLLVDRAAASAFGFAVERLGFKLALPPADLQVPGVVSYLGYDAGLGRLVHLHAHFHLVVGSAWRRHYHLPIEAALLEGVVKRCPFHVPAPEHELLLFVLQQTLRHELRDLVRTEPARLWRNEPELHRLESAADRRTVERELERLLPQVELACFERCLESLRPGVGPAARLAARSDLERRLHSCLRRPPAGAYTTRIVRRILGLGVPGGWRWTPGKRLASGGAVIGLVGAGGPRESTCAGALCHWLGTELQTRRTDLSRPPRGFAIRAVETALGFARGLDRLTGRSTASRLTLHLELLQRVSALRARHVLYSRVRRFAAQGGIAICEHYPVFERSGTADGLPPRGPALVPRSRLAARLRSRERAYRRRLGAPDQLFVLRDGQTGAAAEDGVASGRDDRGGTRDANRSGSAERIVDASRPLEAVLSDLRFYLWESL